MNKPACVLKPEAIIVRSLCYAGGVDMKEGRGEHDEFVSVARFGEFESFIYSLLALVGHGSVFIITVGWERAKPIIHNSGA